MTSESTARLRASAAVAHDSFDLIVLGAGVAGLTAALVAANEGQRVLLLERSSQAGGTSARSSGTVWIPDSPQMRAQGILDDADRAAQYLDALVGDHAPRVLREAFLAAGPRMVEYLERQCGIRFQPYAHAPDYRQDLPGAAQGLRPLEPLAFDGRTLGTRFDEIGWPIPELMLFRGMMVTRGEVARLLKLGGSWGAFWLGARLIARFALDRLTHRRGTRLVLGNALVARLYQNVLQRGVEVRLACDVSRLISGESRVRGVVARWKGAEAQLAASRGVILAGGGFPASPGWRSKYLPAPAPEYTPAFEGCTGDTIALGQQAGGALGPIGEDNGLWFPSSITTRPDGSTAVYPHIVLDRPKPGLIAVNRDGRRFANEALSYHEFVRAMFRENRRVPCIPAMLVCDRRFVWKYGLGMIRPRTPFLGSYIRGGYLHMADTLAELAAMIGVDPAGLQQSVDTNNEYALSGIDLEFGKGTGSYERGNGDASHPPNPCLGPIRKPPFCAVAVVPTPLGTSLGLLTNASAQVLDAAGQPIPGLYACGNDMHSAFGGEYPGAGAQLALGMTFGYLAARHAAGRL